MLFAAQRGLDQAVDFIDDPVGHGEAADGFAGAMDHQRAAGAAVLPVESVWESRCRRRDDNGSSDELARRDAVKPSGD